MRMRWRKVGIGLAVAAAVLAAVFVGGLYLLTHNGAVHRYLLATARQRATKALGAPVRIGDYGLQWHGRSLTVDVDNVVVPGAPPYTNPPLVRIPHLRAAIQITSLLHLTWQLNAITVENPTVSVVQDARGRSNVPNFGGAGGGTPFSLGVRHVAIVNGQFRYDNRAAPFAADLQGVRFGARLAAPDEYVGTLAYESGTVRFPGMPAITHSLQANFTLTPRAADITGVRLASGASLLTGAARIEDFTQPQVSAQFQARLEAGLMQALAGPSLGAGGAIHVTGTAAYRAAPGRPALQALTVAGSFSSPGLIARAAGLGVPIQGLQGTVHMARGELVVSGVHASVAGGELEARLDLSDLANGDGGQAAVRLRGAQLGKLARMAGAGTAATLQEAGLSGTVDLAASASWASGFQRLAAGGNLAMAALLAARPAPAPLHAQAEARFAGGRLTIRRAEVILPGASLAANGAIATAGGGAASLAVRFDSENLTELEALSDGVAAALGRAALPALGLGGAARFQGRLVGSLAAPELAGTFEATGLRVRGTAWRTASARLDVSPTRAHILEAALQGSNGESLHLSAEAALRQWRLLPTNPFRVALSAERVPLGQIAMLMGRPLPLSGLLSAQAQFHGSEQAPLGRGSVAVTAARVHAGGIEEPLRTLSLNFTANGTWLSGTFDAVLPAGAVSGKASFEPRTGAYRAELQAPALELNRLHTVAARHFEVAGVVGVNASGDGSLANPAGRLELSAASLRLGGQSVNDLKVQASLENDVVQATVATNAAATSIQGRATVALRGDDPATAVLDAGRIPLAPLLAAYVPGLPAGMEGEAEIHARLQGPLRDPARVSAEATLPVFTLAYGTAATLRAAEPLHVALTGGTLTLAPVDLQGTDMRLRVAAQVPVTGGGELHASAQGTVGLGIAQAFAPEVALGGELRVNLQASGTLSRPALRGDLEMANLSANSPAWPLGLQDGQGRFELTGDRIAIRSFEGRLGGGTLTASGGVVLQPQLGFELGVQARQVRLLLPPTVRETLAANLSLTGSPEAALLQGRVQIESVSVTPQFDFTQVLSQLGGANAAAPAPGSFTQNLQLNVAVTTPNQINTASRDFSVQANANLTVRGTAAQPVVLGRVNINAGDLIFRGNRYVLQNGALDFSNPAETMPVVNVTADTTIQQYNLHLHFQGPVDNLRTAYTSDPALPPADIINLLAFGQTTEAAAANPTPGNLGAENLIASTVSSQITDRVQRIAGISQLSVDPVLGGAQQNAGARITLQQRVTGNLFVTISTDVTSTQRDVIEIQYKLSPRVSLSAVRDQNGGFGVDARFKKVW